MKWIEISIKTTTEAVEAVSNILYDAGVTGVAIEDINDLKFLNTDEETWDYIDESIFEGNFEGAIVKGYLPLSADLIDKIELIKQLVKHLPQYGLDIGLGEVSTIEVNEEDWSTSWKKYYKPTKIGEKIVIKPTWEDYQKSADEMIIEMDPGMAFGTGTHETTMMCIMELENEIKDAYTVFDIGCGSGILAIAAAKLGANKVIAVDLDEVATKVAHKNVINNNVDDIVEVKQGNLMEVVSGQADVVVTNIIADVIILLSKEIAKFLKQNGIFIASGIILDKIDIVKQHLEEQGLEIIRINKMGEWVCMVSKLKESNDE